jgi:hypothetical protein
MWNYFVSIYNKGSECWKKEHYPEIAAVIVFGLIVVRLLFIDPLIGLSDNGDFGRIMSSAGLEYFEPNDNDFFGFVHTKFMLATLDRKSLTSYPTTHNIPVMIAKGLSRIGSEDTFDTRYLALIYSMVLCFSFWLIISNINFQSKLIEVVFIVLLLIILSDANCLCYFNSLYGEPLAYVSLISLIACFLALTRQDRPKVMVLILLFLNLFMIVGSKLQYGILSILVPVFLVTMFSVRNDKKWRISTIVCSIVTMVYALWLNIAISRPLTNMTIYNSVFYGILKDSRDPKGDLAELGLKTELSALANTTRFEKNKYYDLDSDYFKGEFFSKVDNGKIIKYYLTHPKRLLEKMEVTANKSMQNDKIHLGNYERRSGYGFMTIVNSFNLWTKLKGKYLPKTLWFMIPYYGAFLVLSLIEYSRVAQYGKRRMIELLWCIGFIGLLQFPMPVIGNGEADTYKQLFLFNLTYDILILVSITYGLTKIVNVTGSGKVFMVETRRRHNENR